MVKRPNKDSVLTKHKKWLADLQKKKDELELTVLEEQKKKEDERIKVGVTTKMLCDWRTYTYIYISFVDAKV